MINLSVNQCRVLKADVLDMPTSIVSAYLGTAIDIMCLNLNKHQCKISIRERAANMESTQVWDIACMIYEVRILQRGSSSDQS